MSPPSGSRNVDTGEKKGGSPPKSSILACRGACVHPEDAQLLLAGRHQFFSTGAFASCPYLGLAAAPSCSVQPGEPARMQRGCDSCIWEGMQCKWGAAAAQGCLTFKRAAHVAFKGLGILELLATAGDADPGIPAAAATPSLRLVAAPGRSVGRSRGSSPSVYPCRQAPTAVFWGEKRRFGVSGG